MPSVSIGMPVFNGEATIATAISAVLEQTFEDFELIISDNASTDGTFAICEDAARRDNRIRLIKQESNLGPIENFAAVLRAARAPFFMFAAADDRIEPHFIEETLGLLRVHPDAVACAPQTLIHSSGGKRRLGRGSSAIRNPRWLRPARFLLRPADNSRFYGLYRTDVLRSAYLGRNLRPCHGFDWLISALTLADGAHVSSRSIILHRQAPTFGKYYRQNQASASTLRDRLFPLASMSASLMAELPPAQRLPALPALLFINLGMCAEYVAIDLALRSRGLLARLVPGRTGSC